MDGEQEDEVRLSNFDRGVSLTIPAYCHRAFVTDDDTLVAVQVRDERSGGGGTYIAVVRDAAVMAAVHAKGGSSADVMQAVKSGLLPVAISDYS